MTGTFREQINPIEFDYVLHQLRTFFKKNTYTEVFPQSNISILAACEDPKTVKSFEFENLLWPLPQTNQMHLEHILMQNADILDGLFTITASYRDEPNPIVGRHLRSFTMFEAEHKGDFNHLLSTLSDLMVHLRFVDNVSDIKFMKYEDLCNHYGVKYLESEQENMIWKEFGDVVGITHFPERTSPFFNMKFDNIDDTTGERIYRKCDMIICGQETFGSAERETDLQLMEDSFYTISGGEYAQLLYDKFGKDRVIYELKTFLQQKMIPRWGFGSGFARIHRAMKLKNLI